MIIASQPIIGEKYFCNLTIVNNNKREYAIKEVTLLSFVNNRISKVLFENIEYQVLTYTLQKDFKQAIRTGFSRFMATSLNEAFESFSDCIKLGYITTEEAKEYFAEAIQAKKEELARLAAEISNAESKEF